MMIPDKKDKVVDEKAVEKFIKERKTSTTTRVSTGTMRTITFKVDAELLEKVDRAAKKMGVSRSAFIKSAISSVLENGLTVKLD